MKSCLKVSEIANCNFKVLSHLTYLYCNLLYVKKFHINMIFTLDFRICMVPNDADKDQCVCCSEPKPGSKPKASATPAFGSSTANPAFASVTTSGFKFGASDSNSSNNAASTFKFGSGPATSSTTDSSAKPTGFTFGSTEKSTKPAEPESKPKTSEVSETSSGTSNNSEKKYSREFLSHLKALNNQVSEIIFT